MSLAKMKKKNNYTKTLSVNIVQTFSRTKKLFLVYLVFIHFPPYVGEISWTWCHIPTCTRNELYPKDKE